MTSDRAMASTLPHCAPDGSSAIIRSVYDYARDVLCGALVACDKVKRACARFFRDLERSADEDYPWVFDTLRAERPIVMMERYLVPPKGNYEKMELMPWQRFIEANVYGWVDRRTGMRRYTEALIVVGRGNGKSTLVSGNAIFGVSKDDERGADVYLLANSKEQAGIVFDTAAQQVRASKIASRFRVLRSAIYYDATGGMIQHRASDSRKLDGLNPSMGVFDEIHAYRDYKLINVIKRGMNKRRQPLAIYITTMGTVLDGPLMDYYALFPRAMDDDTMRPEVADRMFCYIAELDADDNIEDSSVWVKANPALGVLLDVKQLEADWERCKHVPQERSDFICKQLNIFTNNADAKYVDFDVLKKNKGSYDEQQLLGRDCYAGFDLALTEDFTSAALLFPIEDRKFVWISHSWVPRAKAELDNEKIPYYEWQMQGYLTIVDGDYVRYELIYEWLVEAASKYYIHSCGYDVANAQMLVRMLEARRMNMNMVRQGSITLNGPMKSLREVLLDGGLVFNNNPMCRWYLDNVKIRQNGRADKDKENWTPSKASRYQKIDGFAALLNAYTEYLRLNQGFGDINTAADIRVLDIFNYQGLQDDDGEIAENEDGSGLISGATPYNLYQIDLSGSKFGSMEDDYEY